MNAITFFRWPTTGTSELRTGLMSRVGRFASQYGVDGYYVLLEPAAVQGGLCGRVNVANRWGHSMPAIALIGMEISTWRAWGYAAPMIAEFKTRRRSPTRCCRSRHRWALPIIVTMKTAMVSM